MCPTALQRPRNKALRYRGRGEDYFICNSGVVIRHKHSGSEENTWWVGRGGGELWPSVLRRKTSGSR